MAEVCLSNYKEVETEINKLISESENKSIIALDDTQENLITKVETKVIDDSITLQLFYGDTKTYEVISDKKQLLCIDSIDNKIINFSHKPIVANASEIIENYTNEDKDISVLH